MVDWLRPRPGHPYFAGSPLMVAHRGGGKLAPENTLAAFRSAVEDWGADMLELDVRLTRDGHVVVLHDDTVDRTTEGSGAVADMSLEQLRELDAGYNFLDLDGRPSFRGHGVRVPTLRELFEACPHVWLNVEIKEEAVAGPLLELIRDCGEGHRVLVAAAHEKHRSDARGHTGPWGANGWQVALFWLLCRLPGRRGYTPRADVLQVPETWRGYRVVSPRFIQEAHRRNIPVHVWTVDEPEDMRRLLVWGVDAIQSDRPDLLSEVLVDVADRPLPPRSRGTIGR
jgi:glycerophosphoryl diester phosphodiesterase